MTDEKSVLNYIKELQKKKDNKLSWNDIRNQLKSFK